MSQAAANVLCSRALTQRPAAGGRASRRGPQAARPGAARATLSGSPARRRDSRVAHLPSLLVTQEPRSVHAPREAEQRAGDSPMLFPRITLRPDDSASLPAPAPHQDDAKKAADEVIALAAKAAAMASALEAFELTPAKASARPSQTGFASARSSAASRRSGEASASRTVASRSSRAAGAGGLPNAAQRTLDAARRRTRVTAESTSQERDRTREGSVSASDGNTISFSAEIGGVPLLTAAQEVELARQIQDSLELERIQAGLMEQLGRPPTLDEWASAVGLTAHAFSERLRRGHRAKDHMVQANLRLVVSVAKKYTGRGVSFQDLVQEGTMGLVRGAEKFDFERGYKFSTYAHWWIRQAITRAIADHSRTIRLPVHMFEYLSRYNKAKKRLLEELGRQPTDAELAADLNLSEEKVVLLSKCAATPTSLDALVGDDRRETRLEDMIEDESVPSGEQTVCETLLREDLSNVLNTLNVREREVLKLRYGLDDGNVKTLEEVGNVFRLTRERIRQIEAKALRKLRQPQRNFALREHMEERLEAAANADINWVGMQKGAAHRRG